MLNLPSRLIKLLYVDSLSIFFRVYKNLLLILEEDLAVSLMLRLLFVPLFHDQTIIGRVLSFQFRIVRILIGLFGYFAATLFMFFLISIWYFSPIAAFLPHLGILSILGKGVFLAGIVLFVYRNKQFPLKRVKHARFEDFWQTTKLSPKDTIFSNLCSDAEVSQLIQSLEVTADIFTGMDIPWSKDLEQTVWDLARKNDAEYITPAYFWVGQVLRLPLIDNLLMKQGLKTLDLKSALALFEYKRDKFRKVFIWDGEFRVRHLKGINRGWIGVPTPVLDSLSTDLTKEAFRAKEDPFVGREKIISDIVNILSQEKNQNVIIVGSAGAGKSSLVRSLAGKIIAGDAPPSLSTKRLVRLDLDKLISGATSKGDLAERVNLIFSEVKFSQNIIIFVDEIQELLDLYPLMLPHLESNDLQFLATTDQENFARIIENKSAFARLFYKVELPPASVEESLKILQELSANLEKEKQIKTTYKALKELITLSSDYIHGRVLPDSALFLFNQCQTSVSGDLINSQTIKQAFSQNVNIPVAEIKEEDREELLNLEEKLHKRMIGQDEAVSAVSNTLRRSSTSLREKDRPIGSFLFVGPTGVGKTELAKLLTEEFFKHKGAFLRFDMSEYQTSDAIERLIGGGEYIGELTEAVEHKPYSLLLLDEFEKSDPKIQTLFLQVLEDGRLTDVSGKHVDFTNAIIIATSNVGSLTIVEELKKGLSFEQIKLKVKNELLQTFKPELLNRFDNIVIFKPLNKVELQKIVKLKLDELNTTLKEQGYLVEFNESLVSKLAERGFDPGFGARPLRRLIQDSVESKLSRFILERKLKKGEAFQVSEEILS